MAQWFLELWSGLELYMTKYIIGENFSSGRATLNKNPSDQTVILSFCFQVPIIWFIANCGGILGLCMGFSLITIFEIGQYMLQILLKKLKCSSAPVTRHESRKSNRPWHDCCHCLGKPCQNGPTPTEEIRCDLNEITDLNVKT